jgi:hypothetical protein
LLLNQKPSTGLSSNPMEGFILHYII